MHLEQAENGKAILHMPFCREYAQGAGLMHGGALVSLADTAVVMAIKSLLPENSHFATVGMESKFLYPVKCGIVTARATVTRQEGRTLEGEATVYNTDGKAVFSFSSVFKIARDIRVRQPE
ncbi:MAG: PaaI family thioesterase [Desulfobacterales bacterium]|nr:PaaI family thioesterase [Desulfobacterales bacterium]MBS3756236.1 PaaI family thioesterase [Desulfobacterales bacterium]